MAYDRYDTRRERERGRDRSISDRERDEGDRYAIGGWGERSGSYSAREERFEQRGTSRERDRERDRDSDRYENRSVGRPMDWTSSQSDYRSGYSGGDRHDRPETGFGSAFSGPGDDRDERRPESNWERDDYRRTSYAGSTRGNDHHYDDWKRRQMNELDRDYADYCRERQERFESDFGNWRENRMTKRQHLGGIQEHMKVVGSDGEPVGKVDCVRGDRVILTRSDSDDNLHHSFDCSLIDSVEKGRIRLQVPAEEAKSRLREEERGDFERDDGERPTLERSFSGTYSN